MGKLDTSEIPIPAMGRDRLNVRVTKIISRAARPEYRWKSALLVLAALVAIVAGLVAGLGLWRTGTSQPTFAEWQAKPTMIDESLAADAGASCLRGTATESRLLVQDQRGPTAALLFQQGQNLVTCVASRGGSGAIEAAAAAYSRIVPSEGLSIVTEMTSPAGSGYPGLRVVVGSVGGPATSVVLERADGGVVTASISSGYFMAWWPTETVVTVVTSTDASGHRLARIQNPVGLHP